MKQLDMFILVDTNKNKYSLANLDCQGDKYKLSKKNKALKRGFEVGKHVLIDDNSEYEIRGFCFNPDDKLLVKLDGCHCYMSWEVSSSRLRLK